jgi:hypothetical protein
MADKINWFLVETPLQVINAAEAMNYFLAEGTKSTLVVKFGCNDKVNQQIEQTLLFFGRATFEVVYLRNRSPGLFFLEWLWLFFRMISHIGRQFFFVGEFNATWMRLLPFFFTGSRYTLLDDGMSTTTLHYHRYDFSKYPANSRLKKAVKIPFFRLLHRGIDRVSLFTMFNLTPIDNQKIDSNDFKLTCSKITNFEIDDEIAYLIGSDYVESLWLSKDDYLRHVGSVVDRCIKLGKTVVYLPHRYEATENFTPFFKKYKESFSIKVLNVPIELYFLQSLKRPSLVVGFASTAIYTLGKMFKPETVVCELSFLDDISTKWLPGLNVAIGHFENATFIECRK